MDMYLSDCFRIDDLLDFSNEDLTTSSSSSSTDSHHHRHHHEPPLPPPQNPFLHDHNPPSLGTFFNISPCTPSTDFTADLCLPNDDVAELEWLSQFVDNCFHDIPAEDEMKMLDSSALQSDTLFPSKARSKRSRASAPSAGKSRPNTEPNGGSSGEGSGVRRCTHCASEKTPQWRTGPLGPKTLCNACGVRYKSGRLVPEYRPAASPTFVLTQHSNSHRKVLELRRQKEMVMMRQQEQEQQEQCYLPPQDFKVC